MFKYTLPKWENDKRLFQSLRKKVVKKKKPNKKDLRQTAYTYAFGEQDSVDLLSYPGLAENANYLQMGELYLRTLVIAGYPFVATTGWLAMLINFNHDIDISYHIDMVSPLLALPKLQRKITELESRKRSLQKDGKIISAELLDPLDSAITLRDKIQRGQEKLFQVSIYMTLSAPSLKELDTHTTILESIMAAKLFVTKVTSFQQLEGLNSTLPRGENILAQKRNLDSGSTALTFPFITSELVHETGILYGVNKSNNSLVIIDRFSLNNANSIIFAQSGSGKSYTAKVEILRQLTSGVHVIVIDPEREYKRLAESVKGTYMKLSTKSKEKINPFDFSVNAFTGESNLAEHIQDLTEILSLMLGGLTPEESATVDSALLETYKNFGFTLRGKTPPNPVELPKKSKQKIKPYPLLKDFYTVLKDRKQHALCHRLEKFVSGSLGTVFNAQTNIAFDNRLIVFDIKDLPESLRQIMMLVIANLVQNQVKLRPQKRILVIDEGWILLQYPQSARFITSLVRRGRKYYLGVSLITQQASDFLNNEYGRAIASQSALRILMRQDTTTIKKVTDEFKLSEYETQFLLTCARGEALIIADQNHVAVRIVASKKEHPLITTDPSEIYFPHATNHI